LIRIGSIHDARVRLDRVGTISVDTAKGERYAMSGRFSRLREGSQQEEHLRQELAKANETIVRQRRRIKRLKEGALELPSVRAENLVWIFGSGRTGSSWLSRMIASPPRRSRWNEPDVGRLFGELYEQAAHRREQESFILADRHRELWLGIVRALVLEGAGARFPERVEGGYVIAKEPQGSVGAPLLMEALPESRMVLLVRDPRDVVASGLDAHRAGSWAAGLGTRMDDLAENSPDRYAQARAELYLRDILRSKRAYDSHGEHKAFVRYEDLMADALGGLRRIHSALKMPVGAKQLERAVERHSWDSVPEERKGSGKIFRKATPGGWREDLTPEQVRIVEEVAGPVFEEFYS